MHGSLARAGKVRGQTPKVAKQARAAAAPRRRSGSKAVPAPNGANAPRCRLCRLQEKKKKPKGRAYKRLQVRRRSSRVQMVGQP